MPAAYRRIRAKVDITHDRDVDLATGAAITYTIAAGEEWDCPAHLAAEFISADAAEEVAPKKAAGRART